MKQSEIDFCARWINLRGADGCVLWVAGVTPHPFEDLSVSYPGCWAPYEKDYDAQCHGCLFVLTPRGVDLVASYEAALSMGLPIVAYDVGEVIDASFEIRIPCPDCDNGRVSLARLGELSDRDRTIVDLVDGPDGRKRRDTRKAEVVVLPEWDVTCPTCKGSRVVLAKPLAGVADAIAVATSKFVASTGVPRAIVDAMIQDYASAVDLAAAWQPLTPELAATLEGETIQTKCGGKVSSVRAGQVNYCGLRVWVENNSYTISTSNPDMRVRLVNPS